MRNSIAFGSPVLVALALAPSAQAAEWFVSPTGTATSGCTTRSVPCSLGSAASGAAPGDTVFLMDGIYRETLYLTTTGTPEAWITFKADQCATPILEGPGVGPAADPDTTSGVGSEVAEYVRFEGIVARGWNIGFGNAWAGGVESTEVSNGHWEIEHCISYSNGRTGFTFFSAPDFKLKHSIAAHNGTSLMHSWSSGVTLFEASGDTNLVQGNISFENSERQQRTDGSGFIVDEESNNVTFINNIAFGNAGSCLRLTRSSGTKFINNTCFHNSRFGAEAIGPTNPSEIYFSNGGVTLDNVTFLNNAIVGTGEEPAGGTPIQNQPPMGWLNNVVTVGAAPFFTDPTGMNPNFLPPAGDTTLIGKGSLAANVPTTDVGFDPKCLVKRTPVMVGEVAREPWWEFDIDIDYIKSIGGVKSCFNPAPRDAAAPDMGAYRAGTITTVPVNSCVPPVIPPPPMGGTGGTGAGGDGAGGTAVAGNNGVGGTTPVAGSPGTGGAGPGTGGAGPGTGGAGPGTGGAGPGTGGAGPGTGGAGPGTGGGVMASGGTTGGTVAAGGTGGAADPEDESGCGCRVTSAAPSKSLAALGLLGLGLFALKRRRRARSF
jgi:MYXO-CTERM domain-containing protein